MRRGPDTRTARVVTDRGGAAVTAGIADLVIMKTSHSAFAGYPRDEFTTLPETHDRLLATALTTAWSYRDADVDFGAAYRAVRATLLDAFARHDSLSVQHTLYAMGQVVLDTIDEVSSITLEMPNRHHLPVDLTRFGMENRNEVFVATEEPHGLIKATLTRPTLRTAALIAMRSWVIRGDRVVLPDGMRPAAIRVDNGVITAIDMQAAFAQAVRWTTGWPSPAQIT